MKFYRIPGVLLLGLLSQHFVYCNVFEQNIDKSIERVSTLIATNALNMDNYKLHPDTALLKLNGLRNTVVGLATTVRHLLITKHGAVNANYDNQSIKLLNKFDIRFRDILLPVVFQREDIWKLERQLGEMEWTLNNLKSNLQRHVPRMHDYNMVEQHARIIIDHLKKYKSIMLTGLPQ